MTTWLWWQMNLEIGPVEKLNKDIDKILVNDKMSDDQAINCIEILRGI
jgi:hypothetical protein